MYTVDVAMTATMRVELLKKTISSFFVCMFDEYVGGGNKLNLILNIDPIGIDNTPGKIESYIDEIRHKFDKIIIRHPPEASFPRAFKWVWMNTGADYVFHLEDDWELMMDVDLQDLIHTLEAENDLALLRLAAFHAGQTTMKNWNKFFPYNGDYYECPDYMAGSVGFCGHPSLIKAEFVKSTAKFLGDIRNPEKEFHRGNAGIRREVEKWRYGVYGYPGSPPLVRDTGREWMIAHGFRKKGSKAFFTQWEKVNKGIT